MCVKSPFLPSASANQRDAEDNEQEEEPAHDSQEDVLHCV